MSEHNEQAKPSASDQSAPLASPRRRRLIKLGATAAPAVLALKSTPVMACNCKIPSGFSTSGADSRKVTACADPGKTPSAWGANCSSSSPYKYSGTNYNKNTTFSSAGFTTTATYTDKTFSQLMKTGMNQDLQALIVAVFLEGSINGGTKFPNITTVRKMWNEGVLSGTYKPYSGLTTTWDAAKVKKYLLYLTGQGW